MASWCSKRKKKKNDIGLESWWSKTKWHKNKGHWLGELVIPKKNGIRKKRTLAWRAGDPKKNGIRRKDTGLESW